MKNDDISAIVTQNPHLDGKYPYRISCKKNSTIADIVEQNRLVEFIPFICQVNAKPVLRDRWTTTVLQKNDAIMFTYYPLQGKAGNTISKLFLIVALNAINPAAGIGLGGIAAVGFNTLAAHVGGLLIDTIIPLPQAAINDFSGFESPSPTYSIQARGNQARIGGVIPVLYGIHKIYPDFAAKPFVSYFDNEEYINLLFSIGMGSFDTDNAKIYIDDTPIEYYESIEKQWTAPSSGGTPSTTSSIINMSTAKVEEVSRLELRATNEIADYQQIDLTQTVKDNAEISSLLPSTGGYRVLTPIEQNKLLDDNITTGLVTKASQRIRVRMHETFLICRLQIFGDINHFSSSRLLIINDNNSLVHRSAYQPYSAIASGSPIGKIDSELPQPVEGRIVVFERNIALNPVISLSKIVIYGIRSHALGWFTANKSDTLIDTVDIDFELPQGLGDRDSNNNLTVSWSVEVKKITNEGGYINRTQRNISSSATALVSETLTNPPKYSLQWQSTAQKTLIASEHKRILTRYENNNAVYEDATVNHYKQSLSASQFQANRSSIGTPLRFTCSYNLPSAGRWQIRIKRTNAAMHVQDRQRYFDKIYLVGIKSSLSTATKPENITFLAMKLKATKNLSSISKLKVNVDIKRILPVYQDGAWQSSQATNSIAWALADVLRNNVYGAGLSDSEIDLQGLTTLNSFWQTRRDSFNGIFDSEKTVWEALQDIARCGRAIPIYRGGKVYFIRDDGQTAPSQLFTDRNIVKDSFSIDYITASEKGPGNVDLEYFDSRRWYPNNVRVNLDHSGYGEAIKLRLFGCTNRQQAQREATYMARANKYRRANLVFETEREGFNLQFGDIIQVQNQMTGWDGQSGDVIGYDTHSHSLELSNPVSFTMAQNSSYNIYIRNRTGGVEHLTVTAGADAHHVVVGSSDVLTAQAIEFSTDAEPPHYVIYQYNTVIKALVRKVTPLDSNRIRIDCIIDAPNIHQNI